MARWLADAARRRVSASLSRCPDAVPAHIGLIMDGNRRFARARGLGPSAGHHAGFETLLRVMEWCLDLGVRCVSVYAFSLDNFSRSDDEVGGLLKLAEDKLEALLTETDLVERHGLQVRVVGDLGRLPAGVQRAAARVMRGTRHHTRHVLNVCLAYTGRADMAAAARELEGAVEAGELLPSDCDERLFEQCLGTSGCPPLDLVVRTSGETRLSNFMLWQCAHAELVFLRPLWPDVGFLDLLHALRRYRRAAPRNRARRADQAARAAAECRARREEAAAGCCGNAAAAEARALRVERFLGARRRALDRWLDAAAHGGPLGAWPPVAEGVRRDGATAPVVVTP